MTGYKPTEILLSTGKGKVEVGNLYLSESGALDEVTVTTQAVIDARGRTIVFPSEGEIKASPTAISLFQKLPLAGLTANPISRNLSIDGGMPIILIDGIPSTMDDVNALRPKDIARIEYSRMTPARYADRGGNGLIAIVLKKRDDGGSVYLYGRSAVNTAFVDASVAASYHQGPSQFRISYVPSWRNYQSVYDDASESYIAPDFRVNLESHDRNPFDYLTNNLSVKYIYSPKESLVFSAAVNTGLSNAHRRIIRSSSDSQLGEYDSRDYSESREDAPSLDLYLRRDFNERNSLEAQVVGTLGFDSYLRDNQYYLDDDNTERFLNEVDSRRRSLIAEISYTHSFNDNTSLSGGFQNTLSHSSNTYAKSDFRPILTENNNYVYAKFSHRIKKVFLSLSTGAKMYWVKNDMNSRTFIKNRSTAQATYNINQKWGMQFAFSYAPQIPSLSELTDYPQQSTPYLVSNGNPSLKVADYFVCQFMPSYSGKLFYAAMLLTYRNSVNATFNDGSYIGDGRFLSQTVNARHMN
ncbi:MAG: outer membrane beta-barrel family protein, partial [Muribaculaceae bacterium]|nr:outer membrane beta-barrel family protein [Muribaculaceae bacterium]